MKRTILLVSAALWISAVDAQACGRKRAACGCHHPRHAAYRPATVATHRHAAPVASSPVYYTGTPISATPGVAAAAPVQLASSGVQPAYDYDPGVGAQPAYYYTVDDSGKLVVAQWMDWLFRGGRAAGMPAPPLPVIGALRNR